MSSVRTIAILLFAFALPLAGCGVKGSLDKPGQAQAEGVGAPSDAESAPEEQRKSKKEFKPFILDGLLR